MRNLPNKLKEIQDPKVLRYLTIGFAALVITIFLTFFIASPSFRHGVLHPHIGLFDNTPVTREHKPHPKAQPQHKLTNRSGHAQNGGAPNKEHPSHSKTGSKGNGANPPSSNGGGGNPSHGEHNPEGGNHENPSPNPSPTPNPTPDPAPNPGNSGNGNGPGSGGSGNGNNPGTSPGKVGVEVEIPGVTLPPVVEETTKGVNETVNGATGKVEETVNGVTKGLGVEVELPPVCVIKCP